MQFWDNKLNKILTVAGVLSLLFPIISATTGNPVSWNALSHGIAAFISISVAIYIAFTEGAELYKPIIFPTSWWGVSMAASTIYISTSRDLNVGIAQLIAMVGCSIAYFAAFGWIRSRASMRTSTIFFTPSMVISLALYLHIWVRYLSGSGTFGTIQIIGFIALGFTTLLFASHLVLYTILPHWSLILAMIFSGSLLFGYTLQVWANIVGKFFFAQLFGGQWLPLLTIVFVISLLNMPTLRESKWLMTNDSKYLKVVPAIVTLFLVAITVFPPQSVSTDDPVTAITLGVLLFFFTVNHVQNIMQQSEIIKELKIVSRTDSLTLIPNRLAILSYLIHLGKKQPETYVIVFGINRFKQVNTHAGPSVGDMILQEVSKIAQRTAKEYNGAAGRLGGDEFVIIVPGKRTDALGCAEDLYNEFSLHSETTKLANVHVKISIGLARQKFDWTEEADLALWEEKAHHRALTPHYANEADLLGSIPISDPMRSINEATQAKRHAKQLNLALAWYSYELEAAEQRNLVMENRLEHSLEHNQIETFFQPIIDLSSGKISSIEALSRWDDDELGAVNPAEFIPIAERSGLIESLGWGTFKRTFDMLTAANDYDATLTCSVNVSPIQLRAPGFVTQLNDLTSYFKIDRTRLILEVTEGLFMDFEDPAVSTINRLSEYGYKIALDDFGMGYSSWSRMSKLPVDIIKIDRSLTLNINDIQGLAVVKSIVEMSHSLELSVVAEGIESEPVREKIASLGAALGQGWLWAKALPKDELIALLQKQSQGLSVGIPNQ